MTRREGPATGGAAGNAVSREEFLFVDSIEDKYARLLLGVEAFDVPTRLLLEAIGPKHLISIASGAIEVPEDRQGSSAFPRRIRRAADDRRHAFLDDRPHIEPRRVCPPPR
jgi:hypothetical protein